MRAWLPMILIMFSCSSLQKWGIRSASPAFRKAGDLTIREKNWNVFRESVAANIKLSELLYLQDTDNKELHRSLIKGYAGYAFGVYETLALEEDFNDSTEGENRKGAIEMYTRSLDYGLSYLEKRGIKRKDLLSLPEKDLQEKFDSELSDDDYTALLYTGQSWGSLINFQKDNMELVAQVPRVKILFDWVCGKAPEIEGGICDIFFAQYEASRPRMLGGNPEKAKELYAQAIRKYPKNLLIRLGQIQFLLLPAMESEPYEKEAKLLQKEFAEWGDLGRNDLEDRSSYQKAQDFNLFNAIAKKRFDIIEKYKSKIF